MSDQPMSSAIIKMTFGRFVSAAGSSGELRQMDTISVIKYGILIAPESYRVIPESASQNPALSRLSEVAVASSFR